MSDIFGRGGFRRGLDGKLSMTVKIPQGENGMTGRECISAECSPRYFQVRCGTGITSAPTQAFCPYCAAVGAPDDFITDRQKKYLERVAEREAMKYAENELAKAWGLRGGKRTLGGGLLKAELSFTPNTPRPMPWLSEDNARREITCPHCTLEHAVFGLAGWCPDCGKDIFLVHVQVEFDVTKSIVKDVEQRRDQMGQRVADRHFENCLEDIVSVFERTLKLMTYRYLVNAGKALTDIDDLFKKKVKNTYQNIERGDDLLFDQTGKRFSSGFAPGDLSFLSHTFEKRHPITHNLGVADRKYLAKVAGAGEEGREVRVTKPELFKAIELSFKAIESAHAQLF